MEAKKEGEIMSLDAIKQVAQAEAETKQRKADAAIAARKLISDAEQAGQKALRDARAEAEAKAKALMAQAEKNAAARTVEIADQAKKDCADLRGAAESRLEAAADLIVRRVVSS